MLATWDTSSTLYSPTYPTRGGSAPRPATANDATLASQIAWLYASNDTVRPRVLHDCAAPPRRAISYSGSIGTRPTGTSSATIPSNATTLVFAAPWASADI